jgi:hypothetical protein
MARVNKIVGNAKNKDTVFALNELMVLQVEFSKVNETGSIYYIHSL